MRRDTPRERILGAAIRLFSNEGICAVGVDRIVAEADVAPRTLYRHFGGKDRLVAAAIEHRSRQWLDWLSGQVERWGSDPVIRFAGLCDALDELSAEEHGGSLMINAATELRSRPDHPAHAAIAEHRRAVRQVLDELATMAGMDDPAHVGEQLQMLIDGAMVAAVADHRPPGPTLRLLLNDMFRSSHGPRSSSRS